MIVLRSDFNVATVDVHVVNTSALENIRSAAGRVGKQGCVQAEPRNQQATPAGEGGFEARAVLAEHKHGGDRGRTGSDDRIAAAKCAEDLLRARIAVVTAGFIAGKAGPVDEGDTMPTARQRRRRGRARWTRPYHNGIERRGHGGQRTSATRNMGWRRMSTSFKPAATSNGRSSPSV